MASVEDIEKAIGAHGMWKARLITAIDLKKLDIDVETIRMDNQCAFEKWLYGSSLTEIDKASKNYKEVKELHAQFHKTAARVAELALKGHREEAEKMMDINGEYTDISYHLTRAMMEWKKVSKK